MQTASEHHVAASRTARYYTMGGAAEAAAGAPASSAWFVLHGYGQLAGEFIRYFADAASPARLIVAPEALSRYYLLPPDAAPASERPVGATWMTREDRDVEIVDYVRYLDTVHEAVAPLLAPNARVEVVGFSQGAATATRWALRGRVQLHRLVLWGGLLPPETPLDSHVLAATRLTLVAGSQDKYLSPERLDTEEQRLRAAGVPVDVIRFEGRHSLKREVIRQLAASEP